LEDYQRKKIPEGQHSLLQKYIKISLILTIFN